MIIGRLAVDQTAQGQGIGSGLLREALARCLTVSKSIGARAVIVHAVDEGVVSFYTDFGFRVFPSNPLTLYITMDEVASAL
jgi:GNAT superfamily N-acetyltransferase